MRILMVAVGPSGIIGVANDLPWKRIPEDMKLFRTKTTDQVVVMGRKTWESIPAKFRPLPDRVNVVVTTQADFNPGDATVEVLLGLNEARLKQLEAKYPGKDIYIIGGSQIYTQALQDDLVDKVFLTNVHCGNEVLPADPKDGVYFDYKSLRDKFALQDMHILTDTPYICYLETYVKTVR